MATKGEAQYAATGLTPVQMNKRILALHGKGLSQRQIGEQVGLSQPSVKYRLDELLRGKKRQSVRRELCEGCWDEFPQLDDTGLCSACRSA